MPLLVSEVNGSFAIAILGHAIGTSLNQQPGKFCVAILSSHVKCSIIAGIVSDIKYILFCFQIKAKDIILFFHPFFTIF